MPVGDLPPSAGSHSHRSETNAVIGITPEANGMSTEALSVIEEFQPEMAP